MSSHVPSPSISGLPPSPEESRPSLPLPDRSDMFRFGENERNDFSFRSAQQLPLPLRDSYRPTPLEGDSYRPRHRDDRHSDRPQRPRYQDENRGGHSRAFYKKPADRPLLSTTRASTPELLTGMDGNDEHNSRYLEVD